MQAVQNYHKTLDMQDLAFATHLVVVVILLVVIRKFSPNFNDTLPVQYQEPELINIVLLYIMPWLNANNLIKIIYTCKI